MHITARNPVSATKDDVPAATLAKETEIAREQTMNDPKNKSKPANIVDKIIEGKMKTWLAENVLLEQPFVKDDTKTVGHCLRRQGVEAGQVRALQGWRDQCIIAGLRLALAWCHASAKRNTARIFTSPMTSSPEARAALPWLISSTFWK